MLPEAGMVDTAVRYHQSVYSSVAGFNADQLSAMPSVHVGWAILVAIAIIGSSQTRWRWLAVLYPVMTTLVVVVTANHFWLDGIVAALLLAFVLAVQGLARRHLGRLRVAREYRRGAGSAGPFPDSLPDSLSEPLPESLEADGSVARREP
jgi:predicted MFS family arabinose efflux permease